MYWREDTVEQYENWKRDGDKWKKVKNKVYRFVCSNCGHRIRRTQGKQKDLPRKCPKCFGEVE